MFNFLQKKPDGTLMDFYVDYLNTKTALAELAIEVAINRIADVIAKCGFNVTSDDPTAKVVLYKLNVKPNANQIATDFWRQAIYRMIRYPNGCLIVDLHDDIFIADSWNTDKSVTREKRYTNVVICVDDSSMTLNKSFRSSEVIHLRYTNPRIMDLLDETNKDINSLYAIAKSGYAMKAPKVKVTIPTNLSLMDSATGQIMTSNQYAEQIAKKLTEGEIKAIVSHSGIDISTIDSKSSLTSADIKQLREEIFTNTAMAFGIPKSILFGDFSENSSNEFITYACEPIMSAIDNSLCAAWLTPDEYMNGSKINVNKLCVKHIDVIDSANNLDKLYSNGWSHNDIMKLLGQPEVNEDWADKRRFTKNYAEEVTGNE